jgi:hypothetical protein
MRSGLSQRVHLKSLTLRGSVQLTHHLPNLFIRRFTWSLTIKTAILIWLYCMLANNGTS